jgi:ABC-type antimicrobial peptide transport system permease subunit
MILMQSLKVILAGVAVGVLGALALNRLIGSLLYGVSPTDPLTFAFAIGILVLVGLAASLLPARQASKIDPILTLRIE